MRIDVLDKASAIGTGLAGECGRRTRTLPPREVVFMEHDPVRRAYVVEDGLVMLHHLFPDGRRQIVDLAGPGELLSWEEGGHACTAETLTFCRITSYELTRVDASPDLQRDLVRRLRRAVRRTQEHVTLLGRKTALERVASLLGRLMDIHGKPAGQGAASIVLPLTRREIADHLGITQETASRSFNELRRRGVIGYKAPSRVRIENVAALALLSGSLRP